MQTQTLHQSLTPIGQGDGVYISTYGCQMNENDSERMLSLLEMMNFRPVTSPDQASLIILNSCAIREKAVHKVHSEVGKYKKLKDLNPKLRIGITGCVAQQEKEKLALDIPLIDFVLGTDAIDSLPEVVARVRQNEASNKWQNRRVVKARFEHQQPYHVETLVRNPGVSTFVNITKGCDNFCTFCVVPFTRGRERSRPASHILDDVRRLVDRGVKEVTLLGQNVNSYLSDCQTNFAQLLKRVARETGIERIRYTTSHPKDFTDELIDIMAENGDKVMEYIHLPVQSGNSEILQRMNRGYSRQDYMQRIERIFKVLPEAVLSTDIIVGFPGETEAQFQDTLSLLDEVPYESLFAFCYSPRPMTKAAKFEDQLPDDVKNERLNRLFEIHNEKARQMAKRYEGRVLKVLVERFDAANDRVQGRSTQNKSVHFRGSENLVGATVDVRILEGFPLTLRGELVV